MHSKTNELNNLTIKHREYVHQHDGLPNRVTRLQEELDNLRKTFADSSRENEHTTTQHVARNAQLLKQIDELRGELDNLEQAKQTEAANARRSLRAAESSFNSELARIEGQRLLQEEMAQANLKVARQEAFSQGETAKTLAAALDASKAEVESMKKGMHFQLHYCWQYTATLLHICSSTHRPCTVCQRANSSPYFATPSCLVDETLILSTTELPTQQIMIARPR